MSIVDYVNHLSFTGVPPGEVSCIAIRIGSHVEVCAGDPTDPTVWTEEWTEDISEERKAEVRQRILDVVRVYHREAGLS